MKNIHRAWAVCLGCTLALLVCGGLCINAFSVTQTSMITTACSVTFLLCMFVVNTYYDKLGYRAGLTLAVLLGVGSFVLFAEARTLPGYYLAGMLAGVSHGLGAMLPASILMLRWFSSRRGTAIGICAAGTGISAVVFSPILSALIERFSLRVCFYFEALVSLLNEDGQPSIVERARVLPPECRMAAADAATLEAIGVAQAHLVEKYGEAIDRESAYELIADEKDAQAEAEQAQKQAVELAKKDKKKGKPTAQALDETRGDNDEK